MEERPVKSATLTTHDISMTVGEYTTTNCTVDPQNAKDSAVQWSSSDSNVATVKNGKITNVYIPDIFGKEKRKAEPSKEGKLGVEGMSSQVILRALDRAGVTSAKILCENPVTTVDFYDLGLTGGVGSKAKRKALCSALDLPEFLSVGSLISCINNSMTKEDFYILCNNIL